MLEKSDLMAIENMFNKFEEKIDQKMEQGFAEQDQKLDQKLNQRFEEQDKKIDQKLDQRFKEFEKVMDKKLDQKLVKTEKKLEKMDLLLLDEIERNRNILEMRMDKMQQDIGEVKTEVRQLYRITEQENARMTMEITELDKRVTKLESCAMA